MEHRPPKPSYFVYWRVTGIWMPSRSDVAEIITKNQVSFEVIASGASAEINAAGEATNKPAEWHGPNGEEVDEQRLEGGKRG